MATKEKAEPFFLSEFLSFALRTPRAAPRRPPPAGNPVTPWTGSSWPPSGVLILKRGADQSECGALFGAAI